MSRRVIPAATVLALLGLLAACGKQSSPAADPYIVRAADAEEQEALTLARDDIDREQRALVALKDAEIERLRSENDELKARIEARARARR